MSYILFCPQFRTAFLPLSWWPYFLLHWQKQSKENFCRLPTLPLPNHWVWATFLSSLLLLGWIHLLISQLPLHLYIWFPASHLLKDFIRSVFPFTVSFQSALRHNFLHLKKQKNKNPKPKPKYPLWPHISLPFNLFLYIAKIWKRLYFLPSLVLLSLEHISIRL